MNPSLSRWLLTLAWTALGSSAFAEDWEVPRTWFDAPDLQGLWTSATITALERPDQFDSLVLTQEQATAWEVESSDALASIDELPEGGLQAGQDVGGYNSFWMDPGTRALRVNGEIRSSILTHPEDGKLPFRLGARAKLGEFFLRVRFRRAGAAPAR